jgi:hypothetical protein
MASKIVTRKPFRFGNFLIPVLIMLALLLASLLPVDVVQTLKTPPATEQRIIPLGAL